MTFNSLAFAIFLPVVWALYWTLRRNLRLQNLFVVIASYVFYGWWDWRFLGLIALTSAWAYAAGRIELARWEKRPSRLLLAASLAVNLGILAVFKYCDFFVGSFVAAFGFLFPASLSASAFSLHLVLPVGISFYTFQALSYSIDAYRREMRPTRDPVAFFAFVSFFPQLVAGPIERASALLPQFLAPRAFAYPEAVAGCRQMLWGLFKKTVVADNCAIVVDQYLNVPGLHNGLMALCSAFLFSFQIYCDFSGYSDIAIGVARLFGIRLSRNFAFPYFSRDIAEFWRRWHISLMTWFRDYLYIPLGGGRCGRWRRIRNVAAVFLVSGLWHGANWTFVAWGALHALLFLPLLLVGKRRRAGPDASPGDLGRILVTFLLVMGGWVVFRATGLAEAGRWLADIVDFRSYALSETFPHAGRVAFPMIGLLVFFELINRREEFGFARLPRRAALRWLAYFALTALIVLYAPGSQTFIYFQF